MANLATYENKQLLPNTGVFGDYTGSGIEKALNSAVAGFAGPDADFGELMRYIAELAWTPDAILQNLSLSWREIDESTVEVTAMSDGGVALVALSFDENDDIVEMNAKERCRADGNGMTPTPWRGFFSNYRLIGGRRIPSHAEVGWVLDSGYYAYWRGDIIEYELLRK